jgi:hypothetical protein
MTEWVYEQMTGEGRDNADIRPENVDMADAARDVL